MGGNSMDADAWRTAVAQSQSSRSSSSALSSCIYITYNGSFLETSVYTAGQEMVYTKGNTMLKPLCTCPSPPDPLGHDSL